VLQPGDRIEIDIPGRRLNVLLSDEELSRRAASRPAPPDRKLDGWLARYQRLVTSANTGAVLE